MAVGISVDNMWYPVGTGNFFNSFFSTIYVKLEDSKWGFKYPITMNKLFEGKLTFDDIELAQKELTDIYYELSKLNPDNIIWNFENLDAQPPWGNNISEDITNMSNYFITSEGEDLIDILNTAYNFAKENKTSVEILNL